MAELTVNFVIRFFHDVADDANRVAIDEVMEERFLVPVQMVKDRKTKTREKLTDYKLQVR